MILWAGLVSSGGSLSGQVPDGPPDIEPTPLNTSDPEPLGVRIIPPFNSADPGSNLLAVGQAVELTVVLSQPDLSQIQWVKDGQNISGETGTHIRIPEVSNQDAGAYRIDVTSSGTTTQSPEEIFEVRLLSEIDDDLASWSHRFFSFEESGDPLVSGEIADPDLDGLSNLTEYFFGLSPTSSNPPPDLAITHSIGSSVLFTYSRTQERTDLEHTVEGSDGLMEWVPLSITNTTVISIDESTERVTVEVEWPFESAFPRFLRLVVDQAEP